MLGVVNNERNFRIPEIEHPLEVNFEGKIRLLGYDLPSRRVEPGDSLPITLYWQPLVNIDTNYKYVLQLTSGQEGELPVVLATTEREPYDGSIATSYWESDITILEHTELPAVPTPPDAETDRLTLRIYDRETLEPLPVTLSESFEVLMDGSTVVLPLQSNPSE